MNKTASSRTFRASLEELARLGSPVDLSVADMEVENEKVEIEQVGWVHGSRLFELQDGRVACMADIAVTNQTSRTIDLIEVELRTPWDDRLFEWLTPVQVQSQGRSKKRNSYRVYPFPGKNELQLQYSEVLNHRLFESKKLPGKRRFEGWLLGIGGVMPAGLRHGQWLAMPLTIITVDSTYETTIRVSTERLPARPAVVNPRRRIFSKLMKENAELGGDVTSTTALPAGLPPASHRN